MLRAIKIARSLSRLASMEASLCQYNRGGGDDPQFGLPALTIVAVGLSRKAWPVFACKSPPSPTEASELNAALSQRNLWILSCGAISGRGLMGCLAPFCWPYTGLIADPYLATAKLLRSRRFPRAAMLFKSGLRLDIILWEGNRGVRKNRVAGKECHSPKRRTRGKEERQANTDRSTGTAARNSSAKPRCRGIWLPGWKVGGSCLSSLATSAP